MRVHIVAITFETWQSVGASFDMKSVKSTFSYPSNPNLDVAVFLDACRILKLIRNTLAEKSVQSVLTDADGNYIKWDYLKKLQELQCSEGLLASERHIQWHGQKMKVKLAAQTLSSSVADALEFCDKQLKKNEFEGSCATVNFIRIVDRLFDILNSQNALARTWLQVSNA